MATVARTEQVKKGAPPKLKLSKPKSEAPIYKYKPEPSSTPAKKQEGKIIEFPVHSTRHVGDRLSPAAVEARNNLIEAHIETAQKLAATIMKRWNSRLPKEEVQSLANVALCEAAARFDPDRGVKFVTYLFYFIKGQLGVAVTASVNDQKGTQFTYIPGEAVATPEEEFNLMRAAKNMAKVKEGFCEFTAAVADRLVLSDQSGVGELAAEMGRARETTSRAKTNVKEVLLEAWRAA